MNFFKVFFCVAMVVVSVGLSSSCLAEVENGIYIIESSLQENQVVDINGGFLEDGAFAHLWQQHDGDNQRFLVQKVTGEECYYIFALHSKLFLGAEEIKEEQQVCQCKDMGTKWVKWQIKSTEDGYYTFQIEDTELFLDVDHSGVANGTILWLYGGNNTNAQKFKLKHCPDRTKAFPEEGVYKIESSTKDGRFADVDDASSNIEGRNLHFYGSTNEEDQHFLLQKAKEEGCYYIFALHSKMCIGVSGDPAHEKLVSQYYFASGVSKKWKITPTVDGYYTFKMVNTDNLFLDAVFGGSDEKTALWLYKGNGTYAQKFGLNSNGLNYDLNELKKEFQQFYQPSVCSKLKIRFKAEKTSDEIFNENESNYNSAGKGTLLQIFVLPGLDFGQHKTNNESGFYPQKSELPLVKVADYRPGSKGWKLKLRMEGNIQNEKGDVLDGVDLRMRLTKLPHEDGVEVDSWNNYLSILNSEHKVINDQDLIFLSVAKGHGYGLTTQDFQEGDIHLYINNKRIKIGKYTGKLKWTLCENES